MHSHRQDINTPNDQLINLDKATIEQCSLPEFAGKGLKLDILRLDKIHPVISGNKWFKLKHYLADAKQKQHSSILTFGGAWSNHIVATACLAGSYGLQATGIIRGERPLNLSATLKAAIHFGMQLKFVSRSAYANKNNTEFTSLTSEPFGNIYVIPEGGAGSLGIQGSMEILLLADLSKYSHIVCSMGTGTMFTGLVAAGLPTQRLIGIAALKGIHYEVDYFPEKCSGGAQVEIFHDFHFGGYAKKTTQLIDFMNYFYRETGVPSDFVYTGKLFFACVELVRKDYFSPGSKVLMIHSGGLQGNSSLPDRTLIF